MPTRYTLSNPEHREAFVARIVEQAMATPKRRRAHSMDNGSIARQLIAVAKGIVATGVTVRTIGRDIIVTGPYDAMRGVIPTLKSLRFQYSPKDKHWFIAKRGLSPDGEKALGIAVSKANRRKFSQ